MSEQPKRWDLRDLAAAWEIANAYQMSSSGVVNWHMREVNKFPDPIVTLDVGRLFSFEQVKVWFTERSKRPAFKGSMKRHGHKADKPLPGPNLVVVRDQVSEWDLEDLVGVGELCEEMLVSRAQVNVLHRKRRDNGFPQPLAVFERGPVFSRVEVRPWLADWAEKSGSRTRISVGTDGR